jgi:pimeloyl-ACP methyl ester carboxylesterase
VVTETDLELSDGRTLHFYDTAADGDAARWVSYDRPGYGGSTPHPGRDVASAAGDVASIADALGIGQFAVMGHSGCPHVLACGALQPERVLGVVCVAGLAPLHAEGLDWFAGMTASGVAQLQAAAAGREALETFLASAEFDPQQFTPADHAALGGAWSWLGDVAGQAIDGGLGGMVDDELAYAGPWGFDPGQISRPVLFLYGGRDRITPSSHGQWLAGRIPSADLWLRRRDGHISVLSSAETAMDWLLDQASPG